MTADAASTSPTSPVELTTRPRRSNRRVRAAHGLYRFATRLHWAEPELVGLGALIRPGDEVIDVGAALGMYTVPLADLVGRTGRVSSFEPQRRGIFTVRLLRVLTGPHRGQVSRVALGPRSGVSTIVVPYHNGFPIFGHGHVEDGAGGETGRQHRSRAPMTTIDSWCAERGITGVAFIKVDVEGFEPAVIEGARGTIDRDRPSLLLEIEDRHLVRYGRTATGFVDELHERWPDYRMYTWVDGTWTPASEVVPAVRNYLFATDAALAR
ncbi:MAG TPA: FkbM family methyltransferase [Pseudolysinimonas sp.]